MIELPDLKKLEFLNKRYNAIYHEIDLLESTKIIDLKDLKSVIADLDNARERLIYLINGLEKNRQEVQENEN